MHTKNHGSQATQHCRSPGLWRRQTFRGLVAEEGPMSTGIGEAHKKKEQLQGCQKQGKCGGRSRSLTERYGSQMEVGDGTLKQGPT